MAKFRNINHSALERAHFLRIERYARAVDQIYADAIKEFAQLAKTVNFDPNKPFSFASYPKTLKTANGLFSEMAGSVKATVLNGMRAEWGEANKNNDRLIKSAYPSVSLSDGRFTQYFNRNLDARDSFERRKANGLDLSDRVWKQTQQFRSEIEMGLDIGLGEGKSAAALSRDLRSNLQDPEKLFRRVRDKHGVLHLSKRAEAYHPGQGVYRSSYKNAMRLTRTEINMAYRESDYMRWQQMDFVIGIEIRLSNNPNHCPMCASLAGKYPKDFKFTGWHPQCRCSAIPLLKSDDELADDIMAILNDEPVGLPDEADGAITAMPANYNKWMADNNQRILTAKSTPYFIRDNYVKGDVSKGLRFVVTEPKPDTLPKLMGMLEQDERFELAIREWKKMKQEGNFPQMNMDHKKIVADYTFDGYIDINRHLNGSDVKPRRSAVMLDLYKDHLNEALDAIPERHSGVVNRGIPTSKSDYLEFYGKKYNRVGEVITEESFMSTSVAKGFDGPVRLSIQVKDAAVISRLSVFPNEKEVLFKAGTRFRVLGYQEIDGRIEVMLEQL